MNNLEGFRPVIGLEIHVQLKTKSKMFSSAPMGEASGPNVNIDEVVTGEPGTLPVVNAEALRLGVMAGLALNCEIPEYSKFDRKHYFYPDLPKGYQISQYDEPVAKKGYVDVTMPDGRIKRVGITRAHLEEDAGKNVHPEGLSYSLVDYNRAGAPLLEIVTEPDIETAEEARLFLEELQRIVRYVGASDADMEKGSMRCEPNISVRKPGEEGLPKYKVEVKNINSFRFAEAAILYEIPRQIALLKEGVMPKQVTMGWNEKDSVTVEQRSKEEANDYRYFPEPDLPILHFAKDHIEKLRSSLPELPAAKRVRFGEEYKIKASDIETLINWKELTYYFEDVVSELQAWQTSDDAAAKISIGQLIQRAANWCVQDFSAALNAEYIKDPADSRITPENFAELVIMVEKGDVSSTAAKTIFKVMFEKGGEPDSIMQDLGLKQVSDDGPIEAAIDAVIAQNPKAVEDYKAGAQKSFGFLVGQTMKELKGQGNPAKVNELLKKKLS